jgi:competence ComEA-like helix-hairpin-helix protein
LRDIKAQVLAGVRSRTGEPPPANAPTGPCIDINSASEEELQRIAQVGPARAKSLVALRPFKSVDGLTRVSGIGDARLAQIKAQGLACVKPRASYTFVSIGPVHRRVAPDLAPLAIRLQRRSPTIARRP